MSNHKNTRKIMISLGVVGAAAAVAGMGTFGTFTSTTSGSEAVASGTVVIDLNSGATSPFGVSATNIVAGDVIQRPVTLNNTGTSDLASIKLTTTAPTTSSLLDTPTGVGNSGNGLQLKIDSCPVAWTSPTPTTPASCTGTATPVLASGPILGADQTLNGLKALGSKMNDNLMVTVSLPTTAGNDFQGKGSVINFAFTGTQRGATNK